MNEFITLDKVIKRNDYKRLSENLKERVEELAGIICDKAEELDIEEVLDYQVRKYSSNIGDEYRLTVYNDEEGYHSLQDVNREYYLHNDYHCRLTGATSAEALEFLNNVKAVLAELDRIETEKANAIQATLDEISNI